MKQPVNYFRYTISNRLGTFATKVLGESDFTVKWQRQDEQKFAYKTELDGKAVFVGEVYEVLLSLETSEFRCEYTDITVDRICRDTGAEVFKPWFTGRLSMNDGGWDLDRCQVEIKITAIDPDQCLEDNKGTEVNLFTEVPDRRAVRMYPFTVTIETKEFSFTTFVGQAPCLTPIWLDPGTPADGRWVSYFHSYLKGAGFCMTLTKWARYTVTVGCADDAPGPEWLLVSTICPGVGKKYVKEANLYSCTDTELPNHTKVHECLIVGQGTDGVIDNGMDLGKVLQSLVNKFCTDIEVVSDFFQINPETVTDTNYVTGEQTKIDKLVLFQKSDIKRPDAINNATKATTTPEKSINALCEMFNCRWRITDNVFRIEHVSFFEQTAGFDLTTQRYAKYMTGKRKYSYQSEKIPIREEFKFMEASEGDFKGLPIFYEGACVTQEGRENVKTHTAEEMTTDMELCFANADGDSNVVDDRGFVLVACREVAGDYVIIVEPPILSSGTKLNNSLSWAHLHRDYHKYYRPLRSGIMNNAATDFISVRPTKKGETITIPLCCEDEFLPDQTMKTLLGVGLVDNATFSFKTNTLEVDLIYPVADLVTNAAPIAVNDMAEVVKNTPQEIDVLANDSDPDGDDIEEIQIFSAPAHGTATVTVDLKISYSPASNYTGSDNITYRIRDSFGNWSNTALVAISVVPPALTLELANDFYSTDKDVVLNQPAAGGLLDNDSTTAGALVATAETKATFQGGTVQIFTDGSFDYTPPAGYFGDDSFPYTASNGTDSDTATATITVINVGGRHLNLGNYSETTGTIVGWCAYDNYQVCRNTDAADDSALAGERVKVIVSVSNDGACHTPIPVEFILEPGDVCSGAGGLPVCDAAPGCGTINTSFVNVEVIP